MILSDQERLKFVAYCKQQAKDCQALREQMEKIHIPDSICGIQQQKATAWAIVAFELDHTQTSILP